MLQCGAVHTYWCAIALRRTQLKDHGCGVGATSSCRTVTTRGSCSNTTAMVFQLGSPQCNGTPAGMHCATLLLLHQSLQEISPHLGTDGATLLSKHHTEIVHVNLWCLQHTTLSPDPGSYIQNGSQTNGRTLVG